MLCAVDRSEAVSPRQGSSERLVGREVLASPVIPESEAIYVDVAEASGLIQPLAVADSLVAVCAIVELFVTHFECSRIGHVLQT